MRKELTKDWLLKQGITVEGDVVYHKTNRYEKKQLNPTISTKKAKYGKDMQYHLIGWYSKEDQRGYTLPLHRLLYAWHKGIVHEGMDIDHKDGDTFNNKLDNLRELTHKENLRNRLNKKANQYYYIKRKENK